MNYSTRRILFYRIDNGLESTQVPLPFQPGEVLSHIDDLPWNKANQEKSRYWYSEGRVTACWPKNFDSNPKVMFGTIRHNELPKIEQAGQLSDLDINPEAGLVESIHLVFFPNNIVGAEYNYYGPRATSFAHYLAEKAKGLCSEFLNFQPLLRHDALQQLKEFQSISLLKLSIHPSFSKILQEIDESLGKSFNVLGKIGEPELVEVSLRTAQYSRFKLGNSVKDIAARLAANPKILNDARALQVRGKRVGSNKTEELDLLSDRLVVQKSIAREANRARALNSDAAYSAIEEAYAELKTELEESASLTVIE